MTEKPDREIFSQRIANWLCGARGKVIFPAHFPKEVKALSNMSKTHVEQMIYAGHARLNQTGLFLNQKQIAFVHHAMPDGQILTVNRANSVHLRQSSRALPLEKHNWPRLNSRPAWPSTPTISESMAMARRGLAPHAIQKYTYTSPRRISICQLRRDPGLACKIVSRQIVGIRSDVRVPSKYLRYFRYRWDFLILSTPWSIPIGLARFMLAQWKTNPFSLWLKDKCYLKTFLRSTDSTVFNCSSVGPW